MVLIGKRMTFGKDQTLKAPSNEETSGRVSASSSSTRFTKKSKPISSAQILYYSIPIQISCSDLMYSLNSYE